MLRKVLLLMALALSVAAIAASQSFDGGDPIPPCSPKTCPQGPGR